MVCGHVDRVEKQLAIFLDVLILLSIVVNQPEMDTVLATVLRDCALFLDGNNPACQLSGMYLVPLVWILVCSVENRTYEELQQYTLAFCSELSCLIITLKAIKNAIESECFLIFGQCRNYIV